MPPNSLWNRDASDPEEVRQEVVAGLKALLLARGETEAEIDAALEQDRIDLLVIDRLLLPPSPARTGDEVIEAVGMDADEAERLWRALGFADARDEPVFSDSDIEALRTIRGLTELGIASQETSVQVTRVLGSSMSRLADALISAADATAEAAGVPAWAERPEDEGLRLAEALAFSSEIVLPNIEQLIIYAWRRHIQAAARRRASLRRSGAMRAPMESELTVGFADMVGFTALSSQLSATALARVVDRFEDLAHTIVVSGGGRTVKMIGDEVMFVTAEPPAALRIALDLVDAYADDDLLSDVRVGIATGPVLLREGDFFGAVVNKASRIVNIADPGTVLVDEASHDCVAGEPSASQGALAGVIAADIAWKQLKPRELKDIGRTTLWSVSRAGRLPASEERRSGARWRRMSALGAELEAIRLKGERVIGSLTTQRPAQDLLAVLSEPTVPGTKGPHEGDQAARILPHGSGS